MQDGIQINRMADRFSSHTLSRPRGASYRPSGSPKALPERPITAAGDVLANGGDPRLVKSRVRP